MSSGRTLLASLYEPGGLLRMVSLESKEPVFFATFGRGDVPTGRPGLKSKTTFEPISEGK